MFEATDTLFDLLAEFDCVFRKKKDNFIITDTVVYMLGVPISYYYFDNDNKQICSKKNYKDISTEKIIKNCVDVGNKKTDVLSVYMSEDCNKISNDKIGGVINHKIQYVYSEFCKEDNISILFYINY
jgi:hypothetical protein